MYIALFKMPTTGTYHWAMVVASNPRTGMMYHNTNEGGAFHFHSQMRTHLLNSIALVCLGKISSLTAFDRDLHCRLAYRLSSIPAANTTCRPWLRTAIVLASEEGFIGATMDEETAAMAMDEALARTQYDERPGGGMDALLFQSSFYDE